MISLAGRAKKSLAEEASDTLGTMRSSLALHRAKKLNVLIVQEEIEAQTSLQQFVEHDAFKYCVAFVIILTSVFMGVEAEMEMSLALRDKKEPMPVWAEVVDMMIFALFCLEIIVRILAWKKKFFCGDNWGVNLFDALPVSIQLCEMVTSAVATHPSSLRAIRSLRLARILRIARLAMIVGHLRQMLLGLYDSLQPLIWAIALLGTVTYACSIAAISASSAALIEDRDFQAEDVTTSRMTTFELAGGFQTDSLGSDALKQQIILYFKSVPRTMWSLLLCITGGMDWYHVAKPLLNIHPIYALGFTAYILFVVLGLLNVLCLDGSDRYDRKRLRSVRSYSWRSGIRSAIDALSFV